jgi:hypothetical protein
MHFFFAPLRETNLVLISLALRAKLALSPFVPRSLRTCLTTVYKSLRFSQELSHYCFIPFVTICKNYVDARIPWFARVLIRCRPSNPSVGSDSPNQGSGSGTGALIR